MADVKLSALSTGPALADADLFYSARDLGGGTFTQCKQAASAVKTYVQTWVAANPTGTIGLTAVNGTATTAMRSDGHPALSQAIVPTWTGLHTFGAGLSVTGNNHQGIVLTATNTYAGALTAANTPIHLAAVLHGTPVTAGSTDSRIAQHRVSISGDDMTVAPSSAYTSSITQAASTGHSGGRIALGTQVSVVGTPATTDYAPYVGGEFITRISSNLLGTGGVSSVNWLGNGFALNANFFATSGATFLGGVYSAEFDIQMPTGTSAGTKTNLLLSLGATDAVRGNFEDASIIISGQGTPAPSVSTWLYGVTFGSKLHRWPFYTDSTLIGAVQAVQGPSTGNTLYAMYGVDLAAVTFTAGGAAFRSPGFAVDDTGNITAKNIFGARAQRSVTSSPITVASTDQILCCNITSGSPTCTLPLASTRAGVPITFKDVGGQFLAHNLTISCTGGELIDGAATYLLANNYAGVTINPLSGGGGWFVT